MIRPPFDATLFDASIKPPHPFFLAMEYGAFAELAAFVLFRPFLPLLPQGDGHPVLIVPGFVQNGLAIAPLRQALGRLGYEAHSWDQGRNLGFSKIALASLRAQVESLAASAREPVSVVGWSLGGIFARELAFEIPHLLRRVITLSTPFGRNPRASNLRWLYDLVAGDGSDIDDAMVLRIRQPLPIPSTAIYSRMDGLVAWEVCIEMSPNAHNENVEVLGSHSGLGFNLQVLQVIADRLSRPLAS